MSAHKKRPGSLVSWFLDFLRKLCSVLVIIFPSRATTTAPNEEAVCTVEEGEDSPVEVYILLGQSNMLGMGKVGAKDDASKEGTLECAVKTKHLYQYLVDKDGNWVTSPTVRNVRCMDAKGGGWKVYDNEFLTIHNGARIGPEVGIGHSLEHSFPKKRIMLLKSCIGNRSLGWDLLPPGSKRYEYKGKEYAGYGESPDSWDKDKPKPKPINWYAGKQYDSDTSHAKEILKEIGKYYPDATKYKIAGFFWWQGDKDRYSEAHAVKYEPNLVRLIHRLRADFDAPDAKFVLATMGQDEMNNAKGNDKPIMEAMLAVDGNSGKYPDFVGNVATVYTHPLSKGGASNGHYNMNAETYMNIGEAMGKAMAELVPGGSGVCAGPSGV